MAIRTITGFFDDNTVATQAVRDLEAAGIPHSDISLVSNNADERWNSTIRPVDEEGSAAGSGATLGAAIGGGAGLLAGLGMLAIPGLGPVVAAGWLAATAAGAIAGGAVGGIVGSLTGAGVSQEHAEVYAEGIRRGGTLVAARVDDTLAPRVNAILANHKAIDPDTRAADYRSGGWTEFDETARPLTPAEIDADRNRYTDRIRY